MSNLKRFWSFPLAHAVNRVRVCACIEGSGDQTIHSTDIDGGVVADVCRGCGEGGKEEVGWSSSYSSSVWHGWLQR